MWPFSSKKTTETTNISETVETTETVAKQEYNSKIIMILLLSMNQYLEECKQKCEMELAVLPEDARQTLWHLESIGLGNTQNAKVIREQIKQYETSQRDIERARKLINFVKSVKEKFGDTTFLVSKEKFKEICKKHNLIIGDLSRYNGVIPHKNVEEVARAVNVINECYENYCIAYDERNFDYYELCDLFSFEKHIIEDRTMYIACPEKYLDNPKVEISRHAVDPIVFQYCPYGVLVHSVWGEEAEDETLKQYFEINNRILNS